MLHPKFENEERHYLHLPPPSIKVFRRLRQMYHGREDNHGSLKVIEKADFPAMLDVWEFAGISKMEGLENERRDWKSGRDVEKEFHEILDSFQAATLCMEIEDMDLLPLCTCVGCFSYLSSKCRVSRRRMVGSYTRKQVLVNRGHN